MLGEGRLIIIWRFSVDKFAVSGLMRREYDRVKLHLTLSSTPSLGRIRGTGERYYQPSVVVVGVGDNNASLSSRELTPSSHVMQW